MDHLDPVTVAETGALVQSPRHDFFVALDRDQGFPEAERGKQLLHCRARLDLPFFAVDQETHRPRAEGGGRGAASGLEDGRAALSVIDSVA
jgi:hypothetical protein